MVYPTGVEMIEIHILSKPRTNIGPQCGEWHRPSPAECVPIMLDVPKILPVKWVRRPKEAGKPGRGRLSAQRGYG